MKLLTKIKNGWDAFQSGRALATKSDLKEMENRIMATQAEITTQLKTVTAQLVKIGTESGTLLTMIKDLQDQLAQGGTVTPELQQAVADLVVQAQVVDDLVPDAPTP